MGIAIRSAQEQDIQSIVELVNRFAAQNIMLPRTEESVRKTLADWLVVIEEASHHQQEQVETLVGCGALVPLNDKLVEIRSVAVHESQHGNGVGSIIVNELVAEARERGYAQACALTLRPNFFERLGFELVDRWSISPKVWQACIYCPKFHRCDEVAVLMNLAKQPDGSEEQAMARSAGWNRLLKHREWQPLRLAYRYEQYAPQTKPVPQT
ncbi:MAG: GNAT family N-acetyltransferase [Caldilineaceae bacterium]|nr:GNAT family N-acetyltransferase [Caldilineaceae bacterium]